ncbi:DHA2 family efflux MFS transporter permease subunit [Salinicoccus roseus]|uniref:DHA2 family efflux MFS transporter permease subunit n=1 Tax=Salinicoccus roseus TaxID=45670 RepID=UPI000F4D5FA9|nr:DHA2 family efflux MFS transporter permease subunit [Salinicoccus roseus]RPE52901.1 EmrB/QacA subfamily drug resistance transporter [Salinicoccus roseus]GGA72471.1 putative MFS-type transporter YcnB [Salinicoccus roseus]
MAEDRIESKGVVVVIIAAAFLLTFNQFLLITAFPTIMAEFDINATQVQWLTNAFILVTLIFIPMSGYLSTTYSARTLVIFSLTCLLIGTAIGGWSPNFGILLLSRMIQAIGAGIILPLIQTILLIVFPYHRRGFAMGLLGAVTNIAPASAPSISGIIIDYLDWRSLHWVILPFILITVVMALFLMKNVLEQNRTTLDLRSVALSASGFALFILGLSNISVYGFLSLWSILPMAVGIVSVLFFIHRQFSIPTPVLNLNLFRNRTFSLAIILIFINMMLLLSTETILPMFAQDALGTSAFLSGFLLVPGTIILSIITFVSGNLYDRYGGKRIATIGFACTAVSLGLINTVGMEDSPYWIMVYFCLFMTGFGLTLMPLVTVSMSELGKADIPHGSAIVNTVRQFAMAFGIIILTSIISITVAVMDAPYATSTYWGTSYALIVMAGLAVLGFILTLRLKETRY